jgi:hypothetical protein
MPKMDVRISCGIRGAEEIHIERVVDVSEEELVQLIPPSVAGGSGGWPYWREAEALVCSIVKEEFFPDEVTSPQNMEALRRLGVTSLSYTFDNEVQGIMGSRPIYPEMASG